MHSLSFIFALLKRFAETRKTSFQLVDLEAGHKMWRDVFLLKKKYFLFDHDGKDFFPSCHAFYYVFTMMCSDGRQMAT